MNLGIDTQTNSNEYCSYIFSPELIDKNCFTIQEPMPLAPTLATPVRQKAPAQDNDLSSAKVARPEEQWTRAGHGHVHSHASMMTACGLRRHNGNCLPSSALQPCPAAI